jgi:uncharacterized protein (TIGR02679 family)
VTTEPAAAGRCGPGPAALDRPELAALWRDAHDRFCSGRPVSTLRPGPLNAEEQAAISDLLGLDRLPGPDPAISRGQLDLALVEAVGDDTVGVVEALLGPLSNRAQARAGLAAERDQLWCWLERHPVVRAQPALQPWVRWLRAAGLIGRSAERTRVVLTQALLVLAAVPADGVALPVLADRLLHDPHALDDGGRLSGIVLRALAGLYGLDPPSDAHTRRLLWQRAGVTDDALSSTVLVAGLRCADTAVVGDVLAACTRAGQAASITLAQLRVSLYRDGSGSTGPVLAGAPPVVWVVENPSVLASALRRFGPRCPPLVCGSGWPSAAAMLLLRGLAAGGAQLRYHGDLDADGVRIAAHVMAATGARPWRMSAAQYRAALARRPDGPAVGRVSEAPWDPQLCPAMVAAGVAVTEEQVTDDLLADLRADLAAPAQGAGSSGFGE